MLPPLKKSLAVPTLQPMCCTQYGTHTLCYKCNWFRLVYWNDTW